MMARRGYVPALEGSDELRGALGELNAYSELIPELLKRVDDVAGERTVTRAELKRDFGFTESGLRILERTRQLVPSRRNGSRPVFVLGRALRIRVLQPGLVTAKGIRTVRKHANITTVHREVLARLTEPGAV